jgi:hypothetical protein
MLCCRRPCTTAAQPIVPCRGCPGQPPPGLPCGPPWPRRALPCRSPAATVIGPPAATAPRRHCRRGGLLLLVLPALLPPQSRSGDHYILSILNFNDDTVSLFHLVLAFISWMAARCKHSNTWKYLICLWKKDWYMNYILLAIYYIALEVIWLFPYSSKWQCKI